MPELAKRLLQSVLIVIQESIARSVKAADMLIQGEMEKATVQIHTSKPPRPKPPRPEGV